MRSVTSHALKAMAVLALASSPLLATQAQAQSQSLAPVNTKEPSISGDAREGETLTGSRGSWVGAPPITYTYAWLRCAATCEPTGGTDQTYVATEADVGSRLEFEVKATNSDGSSTASATTPVVTAAPREPGTAEDPEPSEETQSAQPARLSPFPVVVVTGRARSNGSVITRLVIRRAPRRARVVIRCEGRRRRACPVNVAKFRIKRTRRTRVRRLEGQFSAGTVIKIFIRKGRTLGKYTRLRIRRNAAPARIDRCLEPGSARPVRCDSS